VKYVFLLGAIGFLVGTGFLFNEGMYLLAAITVTATAILGAMFATWEWKEEHSQQPQQEI